MQNALIFCNRKVEVDVLYKSLKRHGFSVGALHGDMDQPARFATLNKFKANELQLLVCSDVAARGIDIGGLSHVFNFDVPFHAEDYVHRIGRTGRAGKEGAAFTIATADDARNVAAIEKLTGRPIPRIEVEGLDEVSNEEIAEAAARPNRGRGGRGAPARGGRPAAGGRDARARPARRRPPIATRRPRRIPADRCGRRRAGTAGRAPARAQPVATGPSVANARRDRGRDRAPVTAARGTSPRRGPRRRATETSRARSAAATGRSRTALPSAPSAAGTATRRAAATATTSAPRCRASAMPSRPSC